MWAAGAALTLPLPLACGWPSHLCANNARASIAAPPLLLPTCILIAGAMGKSSPIIDPRGGMAKPSAGRPKSVDKAPWLTSRSSWWPLSSSLRGLLAPPRSMPSASKGRHPSCNFNVGASVGEQDHTVACLMRLGTLLWESSHFWLCSATTATYIKRMSMGTPFEMSEPSHLSASSLSICRPPSGPGKVRLPCGPPKPKSSSFTHLPVTTEIY